MAGSGIGTAAEVCSSVRGADWTCRLNPAVTSAIAVVANQSSKRILRMTILKLRTGYRTTRTHECSCQGLASQVLQIRVSKRVRPTNSLVVAGLPEVHLKMPTRNLPTIWSPCTFLLANHIIFAASVTTTPRSGNIGCGLSQDVGSALTSEHPLKAVRTADALDAR